MEHPNKEFQEIKEKEVYKIYHPKAQILYRYGKGITKFMIVFFKFMTKPSLFKQINISKLALPFFKEEEYNEDLTLTMSYLEEPLKELLKMPGIDKEKFKGFKNEISPFHEKHKMTLTESHHFINILNDWENVENVETKGKLKEILNDEIKTDEKYFAYFEKNVKNNKKINFVVLEILKKIGNSKKDINLNLPKLEKALSNFETNIKYRSKLIECSLYAKILHFTALEIDNEDEFDEMNLDIEGSAPDFLTKVKVEDEAYRDRFILKFKFLEENWKEFVKSNKKLTKLAEDGHLFIGYCLAKRFQFIFNNEGQAKTKFYGETNSHLFKYASEINQILGNRRVDLEFYKKQANNFKEKILSKCEIQEENLDEIVSNICEIDRDSVKFEHPDEWNLQISKTILDGDFQLADMKFIGVEESDLEHLNLGSGEWFDLKKGASHLIISSLHEILKKNKTTIKKEELKEHLKNVKTIYWKAKLEIEKVVKENKELSKGKEKEIGESSQQRKEIELESVSNETINISSLSAIIYCLTNKFLEMFNEDGVVNMDILLQNISNTNLIEYGMEMNEKLGKKRVDK
uniref:Uncharacterized protein n=1 Tax=Meloidogyne javanica TaxID=6303 RepID=A0A915N9W5_MELJA